MVKKGYKQTEVGVIPEDWDCTTAKRLMKIETGSRNTENKTDTGIYPFFVRSQKIESIDTYYYNCEAVLTAGDGVGTGKVFHYYIGKFDAHQRVYVMSDFDRILGKYFYYYFCENFEDEVSKYTAKSSVDSVRHYMIAEMKIPLPPLPEQHRIAEALSDMDNMISSLEKLIAKYKSIKAACLQQMFPQNGETVPRMRLPGFTDDWEQCELGELALFNPKDELPQTFEYVDLESVVGTEMLSHRTEAKSSAPSRAQRLAHTGDLFYQTVRPYQRNNYLFEKPDNNYVFSTGYAQMRPYVDGYFLLSLVQSDRFVKVVLDNCTGTSYPAINANDLAEIEVTAPLDENEAQKIGTIFRSIDHLITLYQRKLEKVQKIKQGMMQQLLTGKIRLV